MDRRDAQWPLVSAVIITHNRKGLLEKAISSALKQTYASMEYIVVDDGSIDGTEQMMEQYANIDNFRYIRILPEDSRGGNHARNVGILAARGEWLAFLDDDDEWLPEKTEKQIKLLRDRPECKVCYCAKIKDYNFGEWQEREDLSTLMEGDVSKLIFVKSVSLTSSMIVGRELLLDVGMFDETLGFWQDYELCMRAYQQTEVTVVREYLLLYRVLQKDQNRLTNKVYEWEKVVEQIEKKYAQQINSLSREQIKARKLWVYGDGVSRAANCGSKRKQREYLWKKFCVSHRVRDFVKFALNKNSLR